MQSVKMKKKEDIGAKIYSWAKDIYPICRSITGPGVRKTLEYIQERLPALNIFSVPSGTKAYDWTVPDEWTIRDAYVLNSDGHRVIDFQKNNLHIVGYSTPVDKYLSLEELNDHLYSIPDKPNAIPYVTSYYKSRWGFCISHNERVKLSPGQYRVVIDSDMKTGVLNYGEYIIQGESDKEILISTYICHPSMANNEVSGPVVTMALAQWLEKTQRRRHTYRIVFLPETIGSIVYLNKNYNVMKKNIVAGFVVTCIGDNRAYSFMPSRLGNTLADRVATHVLKHKVENYVHYSFLERGSDERQYCSPLIDLPVVSIMRTKYGKYPEYHTSLDDLSLISPDGLEGGYNVLRNALEVLEKNYVYQPLIYCEPQLGKRGLYNIASNEDIDTMGNILAYVDGKKDLIEIATEIESYALDCSVVAENLVAHELLSRK